MFLKADNITFRYEGDEADLFRKLSFEVPGPGFHALFGPSGVGKTTLIRIIAGELRGFSGKVSGPVGNGTLYSYNLERLPGWSTVRRQLEAAAPAENVETLRELVDVFGLESCMEARFGNLSLGQRNRVNLIRYLLQDFRLLMMDESLANVDEMTREQIILKIKSMFPDRCFLYISHNVTEVAKFCQKVLVLRDARKSPQVIAIRGLDFSGEDSGEETLARAMLEIMHAS